MVSRMREGREDDTLLLLEHPHVFTMGKAARPEDVLWNDDQRRSRGVDVVWVDRGGEATYHGPGQLVGYPILDLTRMDITIRDYIARLEASLVAYLDELGSDRSRGAGPDRRLVRRDEARGDRHQAEPLGCEPPASRST